MRQAANIHQLCGFIAADLNNHRSKTSIPTAGSSTTLNNSTGLSDIRYPKSLYLIQPLFSTYELNPVASNAQASVPIPDGLDLDTWIVPPPQEPVAAAVEEATILEKKKRSKKGKERESNGKKSRTSSKKKPRDVELLQDGDILTPVDTDIETPEERERVSALVYTNTRTAPKPIPFPAEGGQKGAIKR